MKTIISRTVLLSLLFFSCTATAQQTTYRFTMTVDPIPAAGPYTESSEVNGFFTVASPLPPSQLIFNLPENTAWEVDLGNGITFSNNDSLRYQWDVPVDTNTTPIGVTTDANGDITTFFGFPVSPLIPHTQTTQRNLLRIQADNIFVISDLSCGLLTPYFKNTTEPEICAGGESQANSSLYVRVAIRSIVWTVDEPGTLGCDQFDGKLGGICNAYCEGVNCDEDGSNKSCGVLANNFVKFGGNSTVPPCADSPTGG